MENMLRRFVKLIVEEPLLMKLIQEELQKKGDPGSLSIVKNVDKDGIFSGLSRILITEDCRIYLLDYNDQELNIPGFQARALYILYLLCPRAISNKELTEYKAELIQIYHEICKNRQFDIFRAETVVEGFFNRKGGIPDATNNIKLALNRIIKDKQILKEYVISGKRKAERKVMLPRKMVIVQNEVLKRIMKKLSNKEL